MERRSIEALFRELGAASDRYLVVGGLAVVAHGYVRLTDIGKAQGKARTPGGCRMADVG